MSTVAIITTLIVMLAALVCYAFVYQTVQHKREKRARLLAALKARSRSFSFMLNGCPDGFLPKELLVLVQRGLIEVLSQLSRLEPKVDSHTKDLKVVNAQLLETQRQNRPAKPVSLQNPQQIKDARACLEELHRFVFQEESRRVIARNQAEAFRNQIRQLVLQLTVDGYAFNGRTARQKNKIKLSLHYYELALNLLVREQRNNDNAASITRLKEIVAELKEQLTQQEDKAETPSKSNTSEVSEEWEKFGEDQDIWKKKNVYD